MEERCELFGGGCGRDRDLWGVNKRPVRLHWSFFG